MKHAHIPVINDTEWKGLSMKDLRKVANDYYRVYIAGNTITNIDKGINVRFTNTGGKHTVYARSGVGYEKLVIIKILPSLVKYGKFSSWGKPKPSHPKDTIGFMRFVAYAKVNGRKRRYTLDIRIDKTGKFYYDLNVYVKNLG